MSNPLAGQALNVQELKRIADEKETAKLQEVLRRRKKEEDEEKPGTAGFHGARLRPDGMERFNGWVRRAAEQGQRRSSSCASPRSTVRTMAGRSTTSRRAGPTR